MKAPKILVLAILALCCISGKHVSFKGKLDDGSQDLSYLACFKVIEPCLRGRGRVHCEQRAGSHRSSPAVRLEKPRDRCRELQICTGLPTRPDLAVKGALSSSR